MISSGTFWLIAGGAIVLAMLFIVIRGTVHDLRAERKRIEKQEWQDEFLRELRHILGVTDPIGHRFPIEAGHGIQLYIEKKGSSLRSETYRLLLSGCILTGEESRVGFIEHTLLEVVRLREGKAILEAHRLIDTLRKYQKHPEAARKRLEADKELDLDVSVGQIAHVQHSQEELEEFHS